MERVLLVTTTFSNRDEGVNIAKAVLQKRLVACAQLSEKCESYYWWKDTIEHSTEFVLTMKTQESLYSELVRFLENTHSYETPEIVAVPVSHLSPGYHKWIQDELSIQKQ